LDEAGLDAHELAARKVEDFASSVRGRVLHGDDVAGADRDVEQLCPEGALGQPEEFEDEGVADGGPARMVSGDGDVPGRCHCASGAKHEAAASMSRAATAA